MMFFSKLFLFIVRCGKKCLVFVVFKGKPRSGSATVTLTRAIRQMVLSWWIVNLHPDHPDRQPPHPPSWLPERRAEEARARRAINSFRFLGDVQTTSSYYPTFVRQSACSRAWDYRPMSLPLMLSSPVVGLFIPLFSFSSTRVVDVRWVQLGRRRKWRTFVNNAQTAAQLLAAWGAFRVSDHRLFLHFFLSPRADSLVSFHLLPSETIFRRMLRVVLATRPLRVRVC